MTTDIRLGGVDIDQVLTAESYLLAAILLDPDRYYDAAPIIGESSAVFHGQVNRVIYDAIADLLATDQPIGAVDVEWWVDHHNHGDVVTVDDILCIVNLNASTAGATVYAERVRDNHRAREVERISASMVERLYKPDPDADQIAVWGMDELASSVAVENTEETAEASAPKLFDHISMMVEARRNGVQIGAGTGIMDLDKILGGLRGGDLCILAARPAMGKTTVALQICYHIVNTGGSAIFYAFETKRDDLLMKLASSLTGIPYNKIRAGDLDDTELEMVGAALVEIAKLDLVIVDDLESVGEVRIHAEAHAARYGAPDMIFVDYIQLMSGESRKGDNRTAEVTYISRQLKTLAMRLGAPVMALAQLNRQVEQRSDKRPLLSDLRESGAIEQDGDTVLMLYADDYYNESSELPNVLEIMVRKNRHGGTGTAKTFFERTCGRIKPLVITRTDLDY